MINCLSARNSFTTLGNGARDQFTELLVLDFLASSIYLSPGRELKAMMKTKDYTTGWSGAKIILGGLGITAKNVHEYVQSLRHCETVLQDLEELSEAIDFVIEVFTYSKDKATIPQNTKDNDLNTLDGERILTLQKLCKQRLNNTKRCIERLNRTFEGQNKALNIQESISVKRLTILASIFLPLSLSSSILSMQTRFINLHLLLYDFLGVFVIVSALALLIYFLVRSILKLKATKLGTAWAPHNLWTVKATKPGTAWAPHNLWTVTKMSPGTGMIRSYSIMLSIWYLSTLVVLVVSFVLGMVVKVNLGLKILGFGFAGLLPYALLLIIWFLYLSVKYL
jgi:CorA-like Mg2+ transporter protein